MTNRKKNLPQERRKKQQVRDPVKILKRRHQVMVKMQLVQKTKKAVKTLVPMMKKEIIQNDQVGIQTLKQSRLTTLN